MPSDRLHDLVLGQAITARKGGASCPPCRWPSRSHPTDPSGSAARGGRRRHRGGREQHRLMRGDLAQDPFDPRRGAVVGRHGLPSHDDLDLVEIELVLLQQVDQSQWSRHMAPTPRFTTSICRWREAPPYGEHRSMQLAATGASTSATCSASSRVGTRTIAAATRAGTPTPLGQHRHRTASCRSRSWPAADVATSECDRNRLRLYRERSSESGSRQSHVDLGRYPDVDECGRDVRVGIDRDGRGLGRCSSWTWSGFATPTSRGPRWAGMFRHVEHGGYRRQLFIPCDA